jgi:exonuclease III
MQREMDMRFGTWNVKSLYRAGSLTTVARELAKLDLQGVQEVRWDRGETNQQTIIHFSMEKGMRIMN